jgi:hypothetical protein
MVLNRIRGDQIAPSTRGLCTSEQQYVRSIPHGWPAGRARAATTTTSSRVVVDGSFTETGAHADTRSTRWAPVSGASEPRPCDDGSEYIHYTTPRLAAVPSVTHTVYNKGGLHVCGCLYVLPFLCH